MTFATFLLIAGLGVIATYITGIQYLKSLRNQTNKKVTSLTLILTSLICGGPIVLFLYCMFSEIRNQDRKREILDILNIRSIVKRAFAENFGDKQEISIAAFTQGGQSLKEAIDGLKRILDRAFTNEYRTLRKGTKVIEYRDGAYGTRRIKSV